MSVSMTMNGAVLPILAFYIVAGLEKGGVKPVDLAQSAAYTVPADGVADLCGNSDSQTVDI